MAKIKNEPAKIFDLPFKFPFKSTEGLNQEFYVEMKDDYFSEAISLLAEKNFVLSSLFCAQDFNDHDFTIFYVFQKQSHQGFLILMKNMNSRDSSGINSIADIFPSASWFEREITDGFGIKVNNSFDDRRLFLHEIYSDNFHPLLKSFKNSKIKTKKKIDEEYAFREVKGEGVHHVPVGPVHAGIIEPGHFRFSVIGETIFNLEIRMFYKHRGVEKLAEGKTPDEVVKIAESISGDESVVNSIGFCLAVEKISDIKVSERDSYLRTILLELERIYSLLGDIAGMIIDVAYPVGASPFFILREEIFRINEKLTGSRFSKDTICIGGLKRTIDNDKLKDAANHLENFEERFVSLIKSVLDAPSVVDRLEGTGIVKPELIKPLSLTGPIARAAGYTQDSRIDHPYLIYEKIPPKMKTYEKSDVLSRFKIKAHEIRDSMRILITAIDRLPKNTAESSVKKIKKISDGYCLVALESARGQNIQFVNMKNGKIIRYKVRTASFCNWQSIQHAVLGNIVPDFPLINKSMNLSYAGTDL